MSKRVWIMAGILAALLLLALGYVVGIAITSPRMASTRPQSPRAETQQVALVISPGESIELVCAAVAPTSTAESPTLTQIPTNTALPTSTPTATSVPTSTPAPTNTPASTPTATSIPTSTPAPTNTPSPTATSAPAGSVYYASPGDNLSTAAGRLRPGDVLILRDGTHRSSITVSAQGTATEPIVIRAEHDGRAVVDGGGSRQPLLIRGSHIVVEGIRFQNSSGHVAEVRNGHDITFRRLTAYDAGNGNYHDFVTHQARDVLLEDCAASGYGRINFLVYESEGVTLRRCYAHWLRRYGSGSACTAFNVYASDRTFLDGCVATLAQNPSVTNVSGLAFWAANWNTTPGARDNVFANGVLHGFRAYHTVQHSREGAVELARNRVENSVITADGYTGILQRAGQDFEVVGVTFVNQSPTWAAFQMDEYAGSSQAEIRDSVFVGNGTGLARSAGTMDHHDNVLAIDRPYIGTSAGSGETHDSVTYGTAQYGLGAHLIRPADAGGWGAQVLYDSTDTRLWPWPMEERICAETAHLFGGGRNGWSVTYEAHQILYDLDGNGQPEIYDCTGGVWRTLDGVY